MPIVTEKEWTGKPLTKAYIFFGHKRPKNLEENLAAQNDPGYQERLKQWLDENNPELKDKAWQDAKKYWTKRRVELGFTEPEE